MSDLLSGAISSLGLPTSLPNFNIASALGIPGSNPNTLTVSAKKYSGEVKPLSLSEFLADMQSRGIAHANMFQATISIAPELMKIVNQWRPGFQARLLPVRCEVAELPGIAFISSENKTYGPTYKNPYQVLYNEITLSFILSSNMDEKYFFDAWASMIKDDNDNYSYYEDFTAPIKITQYDPGGAGVYSVKLHNAFPTSLNALQLNWQDSEFHRLQISFAYERWETIGMNGSAGGGSQLTSGGFLGLGQLGGVIKSLLPTIPGFNAIVTQPGVNQLLNGNFTLQTALQASQAVGLSRNGSGILSNPTVSQAISIIGGGLPSIPIANPLSRLFGGG